LRRATALLIALLVLGSAADARAIAPVRVYDVAGGPPAIPFAGATGRDEIVLAIRDDGTMLVNRRRKGRGSGRVLQKIGLDGRPRGHVVGWKAIEAREWSPFEAVSPRGGLIAYRHGIGDGNWDNGRGPVRAELARSSDAVHRAVSPYFGSEPALGWAPDGRTLVIAGRSRRGRWEAWTLDLPARRARRRVELARPPQGRVLSVAPGGERFAYSTWTDPRGRRAGVDVAIVDLAAGAQPLLQPEAIDAPQPGLRGLRLEDPLWSPAGDLIAASREGTSDLELLDPAGARRIVVPIEDGITGASAWSPDGLAFAYEFKGGGSQQLRIFDVATGATRVLMSRARGGIFTLVWSPDARRVGVTLTP
jgi:hypothetical protein